MAYIDKTIRIFNIKLLIMKNNMIFYMLSNKYLLLTEELL